VAAKEQTMKKTLLVLTLSLVLASVVSAQNQWPDITAYADIFMNQFVTPGTDWKRAQLADTSQSVNERYASLGGEARYLDTPLEAALYAYTSGASNTIPAAAESILPRGNPKQVDTWLGALVFKGIQEYRFLGDTTAVQRHETMLQFITGRGNASRAEIETWYRSNIRSLIASTVNEEFNKISFLLDNYSANSKFSYTVVLTRNTQNQYVLSYERPDRRQDGIKTLSAPTLEALASAMSRSGDFVPAAIDTVRTQAALIPAVVYANWKPNGVDALALVTEALSNFYLNPNQTTYGAIKGIYARYENSTGNFNDALAYTATNSYLHTINALHPGLLSRLKADVTTRNYLELSRIPSDRRYEIFFTPYTTRSGR
jgi:hypothetical protein